MNNPNLTVKTNVSETALKYIKVADHLERGVHVVSGIGTLFNIVTILLLTNRNFNLKFYDFLRCRSICNLAVCLVGIFLSEIPLEHEILNYWSLVSTWFVINVPMRIAFIASAISDNLIILSRLLNLYNKKNSVFYTLSKKVSYSFLYNLKSQM